jgi:hypothetical protein
MIEKLEEYKTSQDGAYMELVGVREVVDKINEIIDFLNDTYLMDVADGIFGRTTISSYDCVEKCPPGTTPSVFVTGLSMIDDNVSNNNIDAICSVTTVSSDVKCPNCGESYYTIEYGESTCVYYPPIIKDGVNINPDRNMHTQHCRCLNCQTRFDI